MPDARHGRQDVGGRPRRQRLRAGTVVIAAAALVVTILPTATGDPVRADQASSAAAALPRAPLPAEAPVAPDITNIDFATRPTLKANSSPGLRGALSGEDGASVPAASPVLSASGPASGFATVGVTWNRGAAPEGTSVAVRSRTGTTWSDWQPVEIEPSESRDPAPGERDGTSPYFIGEVDEVQAAVTTPDDSTPAGLRLVIIDPDGEAAKPATTTAPSPTPTSSTPTSSTPAEPSASTSPEPTASGSAQSAVLTSTPNVTLAAATTPTINSRAAWGADPKLMTWNPQIGQVQGAVVHHTAGTNNYTATQVPSIIRGIYSFHSVSRGWGDIGYNVLVDKFGRAWEGRYGGLDRAVIGAHATGYNSTRFGISVMGNFDTASVPAAVTQTVGKVIGWKFTLHGVKVTTSTIVGHRNVGQTGCPGKNLYAALPSIRSVAAGNIGSASSRNYTHDYTGDGRADLILRNGKAVYTYSSADAGWDARKQVGHGWSAANTFAAGDFTGDGNQDLFMVSGDVLWLYPGVSSGGFTSRVQLGTGWAGLRLAASGQDWNGDGRPDILAVSKADGKLWLYANSGGKTLAARKAVGQGWGGVSLMTMMGKLANGKPALVARDASGTLWMYPGTGTGAFAGSRTKIGTGWGGMASLMGPGDLNNDGKVDLLARTSDGALRMYTGNGGTGFTGWRAIGNGWSGFAKVVAGGAPGPAFDVFAVYPTGELLRYHYRGGTTFERLSGTGVAGTNSLVEVIAAGDWNGDGKADLIARWSNGNLTLHKGGGKGSYQATGTKIGAGWGSFSQVIGGGNWLGTGVPTLIALNRSSGQVWLYPGNGKGAFGNRLLLANGAGGFDAVVAAGRWGGGTVPDLIMRYASTGKLYLYRGHGGAAVTGGTAIGQGWQGTRIVGVGDVTGDGRPDIVASVGRELRIYPGNGAGSFGSMRKAGLLPSGAVPS